MKDKITNLNNGVKAPKVPNKKYIKLLNRHDSVNEKPMSLFNASTLKDKSVIIGSTEVENSVAKPEKNKKILWIKIVLFSLAILVGLTALLIFLMPKPYRPSNINIDFSVAMNLALDPVIDPTTGEEITPKLYPGETIDGTFVIRSTTNEDEENAGVVFVRMRSYAIIDNNYYSNLFWLKLFNDNDWVFGMDNYYYYKYKLSPDEHIDAIKGITLRTDTVNSSFSGKTITIVLEAQALQGEYQAIAEMWPTAPFNWAQLFE